jgi:hypothetical protein
MRTISFDDPNLVALRERRQDGRFRGQVAALVIFVIGACLFITGVVVADVGGGYADLTDTGARGGSAPNCTRLGARECLRNCGCIQCLASGRNQCLFSEQRGICESRAIESGCRPLAILVISISLMILAGFILLTSIILFTRFTRV